MPRLSAFRDNDELDNAIADKTIVYVEGPDDVSFFNNLAGPDVRDRLEFKTPEAGTGYHEVKKRVGELRPVNPKVHGLLDGEAAVALGLFNAFIDNSEVIFRGDEGLIDGLMFLAEYELENLLLCHTGLARFIANDVVVAELGTRNQGEVQRTIDTLTLRYVLFSVIKFTMIALHSEARPCKGIGKIGGQFITKEVGCAHLMRNDVQSEIGPQVEWSEFLAAMHGVVHAIRAHHRGLGFDDAAKRRDALRIADGKLLMKHVKKRYSGSGKWDGHLHGELAQSDYSDRFRDALLEATNTPRRVIR
jgi:hypothetical protein